MKKCSFIGSLLVMMVLSGCVGYNDNDISTTNTTTTLQDTTSQDKIVTRDDFLEALVTLKDATSFTYRSKTYSSSYEIENAYSLEISRVSNKLYDSGVYVAKGFKCSSDDATLTDDGNLSQEYLENETNVYEKDNRFYIVNKWEDYINASAYEVDTIRSEEAIKYYFSKTASIIYDVILNPVENASDIWEDIILTDDDYSESIVENIDGTMSFQFNASVEMYSHYGPSDFSIDISLDENNSVKDFYYTRTTYIDAEREIVSTKNITRFSNFNFNSNGKASLIKFDEENLTVQSKYDMSNIENDVDESDSLNSKAAVELLKSMGMLSSNATSFEYRQTVKNSGNVDVDVDFENNDANATFVDGKVDSVIEKGQVYSNGMVVVEGLAIKDVYINDFNFQEVKLGTFSERYTKSFTPNYDEIIINVTDSDDLIDIVYEEEYINKIYRFNGGMIQFSESSLNELIGANRALSDFGWVSVEEKHITKAIVERSWEDNSVESIIIESKNVSQWNSAMFTNYHVEFNATNVARICVEEADYSGAIYYKEYSFFYDTPLDFNE